MKKMGTFTIGAAAAALLAGSVFTAPASAAPAAAVAASQDMSKATSANIEQVRSRRGWHGHRHGRGWGWGAGAAAAGLLLTAPLWAGAYDDGYYDDGYDGAYAYSGDGGYARCSATFRSFDPESGTYMGYDGIRRTCPYL